MKRRIFALFITAISLLTSCQKGPSLRSDIAKFIASFSLKDARAVYLEAGSFRTDLEGDVYVEERYDFNIKDLSIVSYSYSKKTYRSGVLSEEVIAYTEKVEDKYIYHYSGYEDVTYTAVSIVNNLVTKFFYTASLDEIHQGGMYVGDTLKSVLNQIQDCVSIDEENDLLIYNKPSTIQDTPLEFEQTMVVDSLGMLVSNDAVSTNGTTTRTTHIEVYNVL